MLWRLEEFITLAKLTSIGLLLSIQDIIHYITGMFLRIEWKEASINTTINIITGIKMENTGTWNSDLVVMWGAALISPIAIYFFVGIIEQFSRMSSRQYTIEVYQKAPKKKKKNKPAYEYRPAKKAKPKTKIKPQKKKQTLESPVIEEACISLQSLGYKKQEAKRIVKNIYSSGNCKNAEDIVIAAMSKCV